MGDITIYSDNVKRMTTEIRVIQDNVCQGMIEIGKRLIEIKKELGHGQWLPYLENELGYTNQTGNRLMKIADEFGNSSISRNIKSSKVIELLSVPQERRDDFIERCSDIDSMTVKKLREEIKEFKRQFEYNSNMVEQLERKKQELQAELQHEKDKLPKVETKVVEKVVEKVVDNTDYETISKLQKELSEKSRLYNIVKDNEENYKILMQSYQQDSENYNKLKRDVESLTRQKNDLSRDMSAIEELTPFIHNVNKFIKTDLAPTKYTKAFKQVYHIDVIQTNLLEMVELVQEWVDEIRLELNVEKNNNNVIDVVEVM